MNLNNLSWKYSNPHILEFKVVSDDIDILGHVNNKVYLNWCERVSWDHSAKLGITPDTYKKINVHVLLLEVKIIFLDHFSLMIKLQFQHGLLKLIKKLD